MSDMISRQTVISAICNACGKIDCDKMDKCEKLQLPPANSSEFPNNSDTISRRMAIDVLKEKVFSNLTDEFYGAMQVLDELPSAQLERKMDEWIPCSEGLPEYRKLVDVTTRDLRVKLAYLDSIKEDGTDDLWIIPLEDAECALWNIVAWKPRPEPWKGADDDIH